MKKLIILFVMLALCAGFSFAEEEEDIMGEFWMDRYILILKSTKDYQEAVGVATKASEKLGVKFENEYLEYSKEKGIYFSLNLLDSLYAGKYWPRRYADDYISLENSSDYEGFAPGYIIVVGGVFHEKGRAQKALARVKEFYSDAYVKKARMYMGCIH